MIKFRTAVIMVVGPAANLIRRSGNLNSGLGKND